MDVMIIATKACTHRKNLEKELDCLRIPFRVCFVEDHADLVERFAIRHSPNLIVDNEVVFRRQPTEAELHAFFSTRTSTVLGHHPVIITTRRSHESEIH
ncbi:MAG: thioredoxin family protein [Gammaproteobacteria bacterium]